MIRLSLRLLLYLALSILVCECSFAVGKSTIDPNAGRSQASALTTSSADVTQKVTYEARRKTVLSILTDLSQMTGVTFKAGYNNEDWQVRDRRMNIFVKDIPLTNLMNSIARVMKFQWSKREDNKGIVSYRLYMDRNVLLGAERQRYIEEEKLRQHQIEARQKLISGLEAAAGMSEGELEALKIQNPYIYVMAKNGWASSLPRLFAGIPAAKQAWLYGEALTLDAALLPLDVQQGLAETWQKVCCVTGIDGVCRPSEILERFNDGNVTISSGQMLQGYGQSATAIGDISIKSSKSVVQTFFDDPESDVGKLEGNFALESMSGTPMDAGRFHSYHSKIRTAQAQALEKLDLNEPLIEHSDDPALSAKVKMKIKDHEFSDALAVLAESSSFAIVSDSFDRSFSGLSFSADEIETRAVLDKLQSVCRYNWERHGSTIELHDRDWFRKRAAQIPDAWLEAWHKALKAQGFLDISELSQIAMLTPEQFWANILTDDVLGKMNLHFSIASSQDLLRFYASLDKQQQASVFTGQGLSLDLVSDNSSSSAQVLLQRCSAIRGASQGELRLVGARGKYLGRTEYIFNVVMSSDADAATKLQWKILCPGNSRPAKVKEEDGTKPKG